MEKIKWLKDSIIYTFDPKENIFNNFFNALVGNELIEPVEIVMDYASCEVKFKKEFDIVVVDGQNFIRPISKDVVEPVKEQIKPIELPPDIEEPDIPIVVYKVLGGQLIANNYGQEVSVAIIEREYFKETYPDFAQIESNKTIKLKKGEQVIASFIANKIIEIEIDGIKYKIESRPSLYFTTVQALKEFFDDIQLAKFNKTDEQLKEKIAEKSIYLARRFGLTDDQTKDYQMYPAFKRVTHLYCLQDIISFSFIKNDSNGDSEGMQRVANSLSLGKFSTRDGDSEKKESFFLPDIIKQKIFEAEEDLRKSIFIKSDAVHWKKGGSNGSQSVERLSGCIQNR
ncbi:MAG: hypothetical protein ACRCTZ_00245 [Sarcina sp.]